MPEERLKKLAGDIGQGRFLPFYLFEGPDEYRKRRALEALRKALLGADPPPEAVDRLDDVGAGEVCDRARTVPFFQERRLIIAAGVESYDDGDVTALERYAQDPTPSTVIVFWCAAGLDRRKKLWKFFERREAAFTFPHLVGAARKSRIAADAKRLGLKLTPAAVSYLDYALAADLYTVVGELEKLAVYADGAELDVEEVKRATATSRPESAYDMVKLVSEGKAGPALAAIRRLIWAGERPESLVGLLARQIRLIWLAGEYRAEGLTPAEIASQLGVAPYFVGEYAEAARRIPAARLAELHRTLASIDLRLKSGRVGPELALELFALAAAEP